MAQKKGAKPAPTGKRRKKAVKTEPEIVVTPTVTNETPTVTNETPTVTNETPTVTNETPVPPEVIGSIASAKRVLLPAHLVLTEMKFNEQKELLEQMDNKLNTLLVKGAERDFLLSYDDFLSWFESKCHKKSIPSPFKAFYRQYKKYGKDSNLKNCWLIIQQLKKEQRI
jgi:hypothetical protein